MASGRVLFEYPNALDRKRPVPFPGGPSVEGFLTVMVLIFIGLGAGAAALLLDWDLLEELKWYAAVAGLLFVHVFVRPGRRRLTYWLWMGLRSSTLRVLGRLSWGFLGGGTVRQMLQGGPQPKGTVLIAGTWAHWLYANARVLDDGALDLSGLPLPTLISAPLTWLRGRKPYRHAIRVPLNSTTDLHDKDEQERLASARERMWFRLGQEAEACTMVEPLDPDEIAYCAGPEEMAARQLARGELDGMEMPLIQKFGWLTVSAAARWQLRRNVTSALVALEDAGRPGRAATKAEMDELLDREWGTHRGPVLGISPGSVRLGVERWTSYLLTGFERHVPLDCMSSLLDGSIGRARLALYSWPKTAGAAQFELMVRRAFWQAAAAGFNGRDYVEALEDCDRVSQATREPSGTLHEYAIVLTVPESAREDAERTLTTAYTTPTGGWRPAFAAQEIAAKASLPLGEASHLDRRLTSSWGLALKTGWSTGGLWLPPRKDGKPHNVLVGVAGSDASVVGWDPYDDLSQEAWNAFIWGVMGSGKTNTMQALERRICKPHPKHYLAELKPRLLVVDHKTSLEYGPLIHDLSGEYIVARSWDDVSGVDVEQRALGINISAIHPAERGRFVYDLIRLLLDRLAKRTTLEPWPGVIGIDEMQMLALTIEGRWIISELGKMARDLFWAVLFGTQQMDDVLRKDETASSDTDGLVAASIKNAPTKLALRQARADRHVLMNRLGISEPQCKHLEQLGGEDGADVQAYKGQGILWAHGRSAPVQVVRLGEERRLLAMNPQERIALLGKGPMLGWTGETTRARSTVASLAPARDRRALRGVAERTARVRRSRGGSR